MCATLLSIIYVSAQQRHAPSSDRVIFNSNFGDGTRSTALPLRRQLVNNIINAKENNTIQECNVNAMIKF